ncbi:hypothetical protein [Chloroflexus sp.]|uniref:hypothetical protein n=1 Tax=Chloroflexus sp. TaxID=1904827 RepID=UPI00257C4F18|nr:hypothetical protein [Chloroflexus sp.]
MPLSRLVSLFWLLIIVTSGCTWIRQSNQSDFGQPIPTPTLPDTMSVVIDTTDLGQPITGIGVNINGAYWHDGKLAPALDAFYNELGARIFRVIVETSAWGDLTATTPPSIDYRMLPFESVWAIMHYLEQKPATHVILSVMGAPPAWMDVSQASPEHTERWVETMNNLIAAGRRQGVSLQWFSPLNEIDYGPPEGPKLTPDRYAEVMEQFAVQLQANGHGDIGLIGPEAAFSSATDAYLRALNNKPTITQMLKAVAMHDYVGQLSDIRPALITWPASAPEIWVTEFSQWCTACNEEPTRSNEWSFGADSAEFLIRYLRQGVHAALLYDGVDGFYTHHGTFDYWGVLAYDPTSGEFQVRPRFAAIAQIARFVKPGMVQVGVSADAALPLVAFRDSATGTIHIIGRNATAHPITLTLRNMPAAIEVTLTQTTSTLTPTSTPAIASKIPVAADAIFAVTFITPDK